MCIVEGRGTKDTEEKDPLCSLISSLDECFVWFLCQLLPRCIHCSASQKHLVPGSKLLAEVCLYAAEGFFHYLVISRHLRSLLTSPHHKTCC